MPPRSAFAVRGVPLALLMHALLASVLKQQALFDHRLVIKHSAQECHYRRMSCHLERNGDFRVNMNKLELRPPQNVFRKGSNRPNPLMNVGWMPDVRLELR